jgi:hypothetical protein
VLAAAAAAVVAFFMRFRRRPRSGVDPSAGGSRTGSLAEDASGLWRSLLGRRRRRSASGGEGAVRLYLEVLQRAEERGRARPIGATPEEFQPQLEEAFHASVTDEITAAFEQSRYAGRPLDARTLHELERRWRSVP